MGLSLPSKRADNGLNHLPLKKKKQSCGGQLLCACCGQSGLRGTKLCLRMSGFCLIG